MCISAHRTCISRWALLVSTAATTAAAVEAKKLEEAKEEAEKKVEELEKQVTELEELKKQLEEVKQESETLKQEAETLKQEVESKNAEIESARATVEEKEKELAQVKEEFEKVKASEEEARKTVEELKAELAKEFFKGDFSRVIYSAQDIVFRRRIELLDSGKDGEQMNVTNLNLPFCSYMQVGDPEEDDRLATKNASLAVLGIYQEDLGKNLRTVAVKTKYKAILFFHRRDDIRLAHQLMFWEANPKHPLKMYITVYWRGKELQLPVNISIESINTTPSYNEIDWLKKARLFPSPY